MRTSGFVEFNGPPGFTTGKSCKAPSEHSEEIGHIEMLVDGQAVELESAASRLSVQTHLAGHGLNVTNMDELISLYSCRNPPLRGTSGRLTATLGAAALVLHQAFTPTIAAAR